MKIQGTVTLQIKVVELSETPFCSANFLPGEVWLLPASFWTTDIRKLAVLQSEKKSGFGIL